MQHIDPISKNYRMRLIIPGRFSLKALALYNNSLFYVITIINYYWSKDLLRDTACLHLLASLAELNNRPVSRRVKCNYHYKSTAVLTLCNGMYFQCWSLTPSTGYLFMICNLRARISSLADWSVCVTTNQEASGSISYIYTILKVN